MPYQHDPTPVVPKSGAILVWVLAAAIVWAIVIVAVSRSGHHGRVPAPHGDPTGTPRVAAARSLPSEPTSADAAVGGLVTPATAEPSPATSQRYAGLATWYCRTRATCTRGYGPSDLIAAIDRKDTTFRKGDRVTVRYSCGPRCDRSVTVRIVDVCACVDRRVIDLSSGAFRRLAPLALGVIPVTVERAGPRATLPATDTGEDAQR